MKAEVAAVKARHAQTGADANRSLNSRIGTAHAVATATTATPVSSKQITVEDDIIIIEVPSEVENFTLRFAGSPQDKIVRIFHNKLRAINLYRLRHMETFKDQEQIGIEDGMLML